MADVSHLERMGRELKCPICLSLFNCSVSLTCNHVFCNGCIERSMKSASDCPVCKVPFGRREVRPAPHMDNLVSVYKSMEAASGETLFVSQNAEATEAFDEDDLTTCKAQEGAETLVCDLDTGNHKRRLRKCSSKKPVTGQRPFGSNSAKPSFPTKKRVQVQQYQTPGTQIQPKNVDDGIDRNDTQRDAASDKNKATFSEKRSSSLTPFFWLREEVESEKSSEQTDGDQDMYTPPEVPCFSDIKESDDDVTCETSPKETGADFIDSEMFDWTQRPCSPELCSSAMAMQIGDAAEENGVQKSPEVAFLEATKILKISPKKNVKDTSKRVRASNATEKRQKKKTKITSGQCASGKVISQDVEKSTSKEKMASLRGRTRKSSVKNIDTDKCLTQSDGTKSHLNSNKMAIVDSASPDAGKLSEGSSKSKIGCMNQSKIKKCNSLRRRLGSKVKAGKHKSKTISDQAKEDQPEEILVPPSGNDLLPTSNYKDVSDEGMISKTCEQSRKRMPRSVKKVKFCTEGTKDNSPPVTVAKEVALRSETYQETQGRLGGIKTPVKTDKTIPTTNNFGLVKCKTLPNEIHCAFCQSSKETEASGMMVHYLKEKPVTNFDSTSNTLHVHKYCTEWAPNVYFEDDKVINLENELSRSRRITCSCCGKKGAALGCYEKSCRRSFHVPCARLTPKFRWDYENFVMLCPNHASCQLPNESVKSESKQRRKSALESKPHQDIVKATNERKSSSVSQVKPLKGFKNTVLCCSALTNTEKDIVDEFENLSGVTTLKNWDSTVTHVIASTDENGACRRTLKFLMGVLEGQWILNVHWLKACMAAGELVAEQPYEIAIDIHGIRDGPRLGRLRFLNKQPKLFDGCKFFFMGDFAASYKGYLHDLIIAAGGKVLNRKPISEDAVSPKQSKTTYIIYSCEVPEKCKLSDASRLLNSRRSDAESVANSTGSVAASNSWILNSVAGHKLQDVQE